MREVLQKHSEIFL